MKTEQALLRLRVAVHRRLAGDGSDLLGDEEIEEILKDHDDEAAAGKISRTIRFRGFWKVFRLGARPDRNQ